MKTVRMKRPALFLFILIAVGLIVGLTLHLSDRSINLVDQHLKNAQGANRPLGMPIEGDVDHRFHQFAPWLRLALPTVNRIDQPLGSENGALTYNSQPFWALNEKRGGHHTGDDLNGIGGMNTDLGDPVFAAADGIVSYAGSPSAGWGKILILSHRLADGSTFQTMYAHLHEIEVALGAVVGRAQKIGSVGTADGLYPAHLHYEIRTGNGVDIGAGYAAYPLNRVNPTEFREGAPSLPDDLRPSVHQILLADLAQRDAETLFNQLNNSSNREQLLRILEKQ